MPKKKPTGGQRVAYPGKERKSINLQLTKAARLELLRQKREQLRHGFKGVKRLPSNGDMFEAHIWKTPDIVLPEPRREGDPKHETAVTGPVRPKD